MKLIEIIILRRSGVDPSHVRLDPLRGGLSIAMLCFTGHFQLGIHTIKPDVAEKKLKWTYAVWENYPKVDVEILPLL